MSDVHTCSYHCHLPECIKAQRDELRDRLAAAEADAERWKAVKDLVGHWQDGSNETVTIFIDEVTKTAFVKAGRQTFFEDGCGLDAAIDKARGAGDE